LLVALTAGFNLEAVEAGLDQLEQQGQQGLVVLVFLRL
jgi:hypothetical protein